MATPRNAPCPCGSGQRYKDCHGNLTAPPPIEHGAAHEVAALLERAQAELAAGNASAAVTACRAAVARADADVAAWNLLGVALRRAGSSEAEDAWRHTLSIEPENGEARFHLGNVLRERGDATAAAAEYRRALIGAPLHVALLNNLGLALEALGQREDAVGCYRQVLALDPGHADALGNLANIQFDTSDFAACAKTYERLFAIRRHLPVPVLVRRAIALQKSRQLIAAEAAFREAADLAPDDAQIFANVGSLCVEQARYADADAPLVRALELDPANAYALSMLAHARAQRCAWDGIEDLFASLQRLLETDRGEGAWSVAPFPLHAMPLPPQLHLRAARDWARTIRRGPAPSRPPLRIEPGRRIRLGFVSSDFRDHAVTTLMMEVWERLDRERFEAYAYGIAAPDTGAVGARIARAFEHFIDMSAEPTAAAAQRIRDDEIAILFDLNGYTRNAKPEIFALRPAPIQINSMGFPGTLGAEWYDYIHVDAFVAPPSEAMHFSERLLLMPASYVPSDTSRAPRGAAPSRAECGLPELGFVFCCFNNAFKILPGVFLTWMRLLAAVPGSVLWLLEASAEAQSNLRRAASSSGIDPNRIVFARRLPNAEHVARNAAADLFLDTAPYGAHTTTNDALLAGLPVLTCAGETLASRNPGSQLRAIGLPELVTMRPSDYEAVALRLARSPGELAAVRSRLAANRRTHPLFDMARYTRDLEDRLLEIWRDYQEGGATASR